jgi:uncharacterized protein YndB with AHSA1/START domain
MLKIIAVVVLLLIAVVLGIAATKPDTLHVQRTATIHAPPEKIFPLINDYRSWTAWSPYEKIDPAMKRTYSGAPAGTGAVYEWEGNRKVGKGRMETTDVSSPSHITIKLDFLKPFEAHNTAEFTLAPRGDSTDVTWTMSGPCPFISKVMSVFVDMDKMIGKDFEAGLANLKTATES